MQPLFYANTFKEIKKISKYGIDPAENTFKANCSKTSKDPIKINIDNQGRRQPILDKKQSGVIPFDFAVKELHQFLKLLIGNTHICSIWHGAFLDENVVVLTTHIAQFL